MLTESYKQWEETLQRKLNELQEQAKPILTEIERTKRQIALVRQLVQIEEGSAPPTDAKESLSERPNTLAEAVRDILEQANGPLHISAIRERFLATGRTIPGQGTESNLLSYIVRDSRFTRVSKGTYTLNPPGSTPKQTKHQRRRRKRKAKVTQKARVSPKEEDA